MKAALTLGLMIMLAVAVLSGCFVGVANSSDVGGTMIRSGGEQVENAGSVEVSSRAALSYDKNGFLSWESYLSDGRASEPGDPYDQYLDEKAAFEITARRSCVELLSDLNSQLAVKGFTNESVYSEWGNRCLHGDDQVAVKGWDDVKVLAK